MSFTRRVVLVAVSSLLWAGLAVLGCGVSHVRAHPPLIALALVLLAMMIVAVFPQSSMGVGVKEDRRNRWVLLAFTLTGLAAGFLPAYTDRRGFWVMDGETVRWIGLGVFALGGVLRLWPVYVLGRRFSGLVAIQQGHTLETCGIYRFIRHPSYLGLLLTLLGWALAFRSWVGVLLTVIVLPPLLARIRSEEALLSGHFGEEYETYRAHTWRLLPGLY
jgi:protein-S-isoprenylcysteine O-methyltransferase Ste14